MRGLPLGKRRPGCLASTDQPPLSEGSVSVKAVIVACAAAAGVAGSVALGSLLAPDAIVCPPGSLPGPERNAGVARGHDHGDGHGPAHGRPGQVVLGPTCNVVELAAPPDSTYRPDVTGASRADRARARRLLSGVNEFCRNHTASDITSRWLAGQASQTSPTHFFNPDRRGSLGLDPMNPRAVLVYRQGIGGVMFTGTPLPRLGSIPRAHTHDPSRPREMLHVYCADDVAEAFTPSRQRGVLVDSIALRQKIRPRVAGVVDPHLAAVHRRMSSYVGHELSPAEPRSDTDQLVDPVLRARRDQIRQSLVLLTEPELRTVWAMVRGAPRGSS